MIFWNIVDNQSLVAKEKIKNSLALVPSGLVDKKIYDNVFVSVKNLFEHCEESIRVPFFLLHHAMSTTERIYPAKNIKSFVMLALGQHIGLSALFYPDSSQFWMKTKSRFIRKKDHSVFLTSLYQKEFFLMSYQILQLLPLLLAHIGKWAAAKKIQVALYISGLDVLSVSHHGPSQDILRQQSRPTCFSSNQILGGPSVRLSLSAVGFFHQFGQVDRASAPLPTLIPLDHLPFGSISPHSNESHQIILQFVMISNLAEPKESLQFEIQSMLPELFQPFVRGLFGLLICWLLLKGSLFFLLKKVFNPFQGGIIQKKH
jgi:hypothetical protein